MIGKLYGLKALDKKGFLILAAGVFLLGLSLVIWKERSTLVICYVIGGLMLVYGLVDTLRFFLGESKPGDGAFRTGLVDGALSMGIGLFFVLRPAQVVEAFGVIMGILLLVDGLFKLQFAVNLKKAAYDKARVVLILALLGLALGIVVIAVDSIAPLWLGIMLMAGGLWDLTAMFLVLRFEKQEIKSAAQGK